MVRPYMKTCAIVVAAGTSQRMGFDKLMAPLAGKAVLQHSLEALSQCEDIDGIVVVAGEERRVFIEGLGLTNVVAIVEGGAERHHSVANGLAAVPQETEFVAVHDAARPLIQAEQISACLAAAREHGAASLAHRITETVKRADESGFVTESLDRNNLWAMETPQCFRLDLLREAYSVVLKDGLFITDEVSAMQHFGKGVRVIENYHQNPKITFKADISFAEKLKL
ncbi:MAG: 2-C-methyl-D-erythritol 4-phosphate cytidylyltransferase [Verrucomicrobiota bacterium]